MWTTHLRCVNRGTLLAGLALFASCFISPGLCRAQHPVLGGEIQSCVQHLSTGTPMFGGASCVVSVYSTTEVDGKITTAISQVRQDALTKLDKVPDAVKDSIREEVLQQLRNDRVVQEANLAAQTTFAGSQSGHAVRLPLAIILASIIFLVGILVGLTGQFLGARILPKKFLRP